MSWIDDTIAEFGMSMNIPGMAFNHHGVVSLNIEKVGAVLIEKSECDVLVLMLRPFPQFAEDVCRRALDLCHYKNNPPFPVSTGLKREELLAFIMRIPERAFTLQAIESSLEYLAKLHEAAGSAC